MRSKGKVKIITWLKMIAETSIGHITQVSQADLDISFPRSDFLIQ